MVTAGYSQGLLSLRSGFRGRDNVRVRVMVRVTFASVLECTGIRNLHLATVALSYGGHESPRHKHARSPGHPHTAYTPRAPGVPLHKDRERACRNEQV